MKPFETLTVGGCEYHFKITAANAVKLEEQLGTDMLTGLEKLTEIKTLALYYYAAGTSLNDSIKTIEDVYQLIDDYVTEGGNVDTLQRLMFDILLTSGILTAEVHEASKKAAEKQLAALQKLLK